MVRTSNEIRNGLVRLRRNALLPILLVGLGCNAQETSAPRQETLVDVLARPQDFLGELISVMGFLTEYANLELFLSKEHAIARDSISAIVVGDYDDRGIHRSQCLDNEVEITGELDSGTAGDYYFVGVTKITLISTNEICWERDAG